MVGEVKKRFPTHRFKVFVIEPINQIDQLVTLLYLTLMVLDTPFKMFDYCLSADHCVTPLSNHSASEEAAPVRLRIDLKVALLDRAPERNR